MNSFREYINYYNNQLIKLKVMNKLIKIAIFLAAFAVRAENAFIHAVIAINCDDLDTVTLTQVNITDQPFQIMQGHLDPSGFWLSGSLRIFSADYSMPKSTAPSFHFEHFDWPNELITMAPRQIFVSEFKLSDYFDMQRFVISSIDYKNYYIEVTINEVDTSTTINSNHFVVHEDCGSTQVRED